MRLSSTIDTAVDSRIGSPYFDQGRVAESLTVDASAGAVQTVTLTGDTDLDIVNGTDGQTLTLLVRQGGPGSHAIQWPVDVWWEVTPTLTAPTGHVDAFTFLRSEGIWYAFVSGMDFFNPLIHRDTFTAPDGTLLTDHQPPQAAGPYTLDTTNATLTNANNVSAQIIGGKATGQPGVNSGNLIAVPQPEVVARLDYDVTGGSNPFDRLNLAICANTSTSTSTLVASIRQNRIIVYLDALGDGVYSEFGTQTAGSIELGYDGSEAWFVHNGTEKWRAPLTGRTAARVGIAFGSGPRRSATNFVVERA